MSFFFMGEQLSAELLTFSVLPTAAQLKGTFSVWK
jgi:hypothetical protein